MDDEQPLRTFPVDLDERAAMLDDAAFEHQYFLDTDTGEIILVSDMSAEHAMQQQLSKLGNPMPRLRFYVDSTSGLFRKNSAIWPGLPGELSSGGLLDQGFAHGAQASGSGH